MLSCSSKDGAVLRRATLKILLLSSPPSKSVVLPFGCSFIDDTIYITYKISWKKKNLFWATLAATVLAFVLSPFSIQADGSINYAMFFIAMLLLLFAFVVNILLVVRKCRAFGHGVGFAIGMLFFEPIFTLILGFGSSAYLGPQD